jgi:hypothetical protein
MTLKRLGKWALAFYVATQVVPGTVAGVVFALHLKGII